METMTYQEWSKKRQSRGAERRKGRKSARVVTLGVRERRRLLQLAVCVMLFGVALVGKGVFPQRMEEAGGRILALIHADTDFEAVFSQLGERIQGSGPVGEGLAEAWTAVFGVSGKPAAVNCGGMLLTREQSRTIAGVPENGLWSWLTETPAEEAAPFVQTFAAHRTAAVPEEAAPAVVPMDYDGPALPANATMDRYDLGLAETVTPALGWVSSPFGWREHPVDGGEKFHNGVDLAVNSGTEIGAFAAGTVDYIGDSPVYGLYLQLDHGGGIKSFYAHCQELLVQQGQQVAAGETVALSGATGNATGPHLHFELKREGILLNPLYYIETTGG